MNGSPNKERLIGILLDKHITAKTIALMCITKLTEEQAHEIVQENELYLYNKKHEVMT